MQFVSLKILTLHHEGKQSLKNFNIGIIITFLFKNICWETYELIDHSVKVLTVLKIQYNKTY